MPASVSTNATGDYSKSSKCLRRLFDSDSGIVVLDASLGIGIGNARSVAKISRAAGFGERPFLGASIRSRCRPIPKPALPRSLLLLDKIAYCNEILISL